MGLNKLINELRRDSTGALRDYYTPPKWVSERCVLIGTVRNYIRCVGYDQ